MKDRYADFGRRLRAMMQDRDLTQQELARMTGLSQQSLSGWVRGEHIPKGKRLQILSEFFDVAPRDLCPEAFDQEAVRLARSNIQFNPILGRADWYVLTCKMPVDRKFLDAVLAANADFERRRVSEGFDDIEIK